MLVTLYIEDYLTSSSAKMYLENDLLAFCLTQFSLQASNVHAHVVCCPAGSSATAITKPQQKKPTDAAPVTGSTNNRLSNFSSMRLTGKSTPNPVRRNTTRGSHGPQQQGPHGTRSQPNMRQLSVDPSMLQSNNTNIISAIQHHSSAPQTPLAGENERHLPLTRQKSLVNNGTTNTDSELHVI